MAGIESLKSLDAIEKDLLSAMHSAGQAVQELSKDKPSYKQVENHTNAFVKTLQNVEANITKQIVYLSQVTTGQAHEGSTYGSQKVSAMARHRLEHVKSKLKDMEQLKQLPHNAFIYQNAQQQQLQHHQQQAQSHQQHLQQAQSHQQTQMAQQMHHQQQLQPQPMPQQYQQMQSHQQLQQQPI